MSNALDAALVDLYGAINPLEHHRPTLKDVEQARDKAKKASKILDAAHSLMSMEIYSVADAPPLPGTPLPFPATPPPAPARQAAPDPAPELPTLGYTEAEVVETIEFDQAAAPCDWDRKSPAEQDQMFHGLLGDLESACQTDGATLKALKPQRTAWENRYLIDGRRTWTLLYAVYYGGGSPASMEIPGEDQLPELLAAAREGEDA